MSKGYAAPMAPAALDAPESGGAGGGGMSGPVMKRDIGMKSSMSFKRTGSEGPPNFEARGGKRMFERGARR